MKELSITQSFMLCILNKNGKFVINNNRAAARVVAGSLMDLLLKDCICITDKKVTIKSHLRGELFYLQSFYDYVKEKEPVKLEKLIENYCFTLSGKRMNELLYAVGDSIVKLNCAELKQSGLLGNKEVFIPTKAAANEVIGDIRAEVLGSEKLSEEMVALVSLLENSNVLKQYFSSYEKNKLKICLKEIKKESSNQIIKDMLDYLDILIAAIVL